MNCVRPTSGEGAGIVIDIACVTLPPSFAALIVKWNVPAVVVGVPDITPELDKLKPGGNTPSVLLQVIVGLPVAVSVWLYVTPVAPFCNVLVAITGGVAASRISMDYVPLPPPIA